ncbi:MAG: hypothetical protein WCJ56_04430 [bacterium]
MKKVLRIVFGILGAIWFGAMFIAGYLAYFVTLPGPCDGLGRHLYVTPMFFRFVLGQERMWAGLWWTLGEMFIFGISMLVATSLFKWLEKD